MTDEKDLVVQADRDEMEFAVGKMLGAAARGDEQSMRLLRVVANAAPSLIATPEPE